MSSSEKDIPVALVTGSGAPRIGKCIARTLAAAGYRLALHANRSLAEAGALAAELTASGNDALAVGADLRDETAIRRMVDGVRRHFGRIDALVNCAAIWESRRLEEITAADVRRHFEINALATFLCCQQVGLLMVEQATGGAIVNIGDWAIARPYLNYAAYFLSKAAVPTMTRTFAIELSARNPRVRVNAVLPGPVLMPAELAPEEREEAVRQTLLRREGRPQNVADAVLFLLENDYVTGVCLNVDGGRAIWPG